MPAESSSYLIEWRPAGAPTWFLYRSCEREAQRDAILADLQRGDMPISRGKEFRAKDKARKATGRPPK